MSEAAWTVIHKSLHRQVFFLGVDRELGMCVVLFSVVTAFGGKNLVAVIAAVVFWLLAMRYLRKWTKEDPLIRDVFLRHVRYTKKRTVLFLAKPGVYSSGPLNLWRSKA
jgi:type IV secretion system protein VirB3